VVPEGGFQRCSAGVLECLEGVEMENFLAPGNFPEKILRCEKNLPARKKF
jgi:hypothetical protein